QSSCCQWPLEVGCMESYNVKCPVGTCKLIASYVGEAGELYPAGTTLDELCDPSNWTAWYFEHIRDFAV
ncbi:MAG TPA: hypothetical protein VI387_10915, partial [Candidatus Brocadiales bacterium]|nr:hypothetical protein [Candidatus Brocadiales bacterium]